MILNSSKFTRYPHFGTVPIYKVSGERPSTHRFFDTSPISPSGHYIAYTEFHRDDERPRPGDPADVVVIDLESGAEVYRTETAAWDTQLGAQVQWGGTDAELLFNRVDENWTVYGVRYDLSSGTEDRLPGPVYMVSSDGNYSASPSMNKLQHVQVGYGVRVPREAAPLNEGAPLDDGLFVTDLRSGRHSMLVSIRDIYTELSPHFQDLRMTEGGFYGFHVKWSPARDALMFLIRWKPKALGTKSKNYLITMKADGSQLAMAMPSRKWGNGHHPNWCPDGKSIIMNVSIANDMHFPWLDRAVSKVLRKAHIPYYTRAYDLRFGRFRADGSDLQVLSKRAYGSGHPSMHPNGRLVLADAYPHERVSFGDGTVPIRLLDLSEDRELLAARVPAVPMFAGEHAEWRVDPHPVWHRDGKHVTFNAAPNKLRGVFIADFSSLPNIG
jgi:hypothetical protein